MRTLFWHACLAPDILEHLQTTENGLSLKKVNHRRKIHGLNLLQAIQVRSPFLRFLSQFHNILIYMLLCSAFIAIFLRYWVDASVILGVVVLNALIGFIQEGKAEKAVQAISSLLSPKATVVRNGKRYVVPAEGLVLGDIVLLNPGDKVPADLRLLSTKSLLIQESLLTGESLPINKSAEPVPVDTPLYERSSMAYSGTVVSHGIGKGIVVAIGQKTEIGRISSLLAQIPNLTTPLTRQITKFGRFLSIGIFFIAVIAFIVGIVFRHYSMEQMFMAAISLIVAAIPEGLPAILTITLAIGVTRMAKQNAIIRRLPAVETMGSVNVICTDKTGTLTENELMVQNIITSARGYELNQNSEIWSSLFSSSNQGSVADEHFGLRRLIEAVLLCNEAELSSEEHEVIGEPIDKALLIWGNWAHQDVHLMRQSFPRDDLIPFESQHKFMATLHHDHQGNGYIYVKGSPERLLKFSSTQLVDRNKHLKEPIDVNYWKQQIDFFASKGLRVIAVAMKKTGLDHRVLSFQDIDQQFIFLGILGLIDPPRPGVKEAIAQCQQAGIDIKIITGDHALTAKTIGEQIGLRNLRYMVGDELDHLSDQELCNIIDQVNIYARTNPEHKLRLVQILQSLDHVVAMTGDGVNDAPALRQADIGVAMGQKGTEASKEVAEMVLADDNFVSITRAIEEGRTVYDNLKRVILYILPTDISESLVIVLAIFLGQMFPITPLQILWINTVTTITLTLPLSFEKAEDEVMKRFPRPKNAPFLSPVLIWRVFFVGFLLLSCVFGLFLVTMHNRSGLLVARTVAVNMLVVGEWSYLLHCRKLYRVSWNPLELIRNPMTLVSIISVMILQLLLTYVPFFQHFFDTASISIMQWVRILGLGVVLYFAIGLEKMFIGHRHRG